MTIDKLAHKLMDEIMNTAILGIPDSERGKYYAHDCENGLYIVWDRERGIISLVKARNPQDAANKVRWAKE